MANFNEAFKILMRLEFSFPENALHKNPTENGLTFMGVYEAGGKCGQRSTHMVI